MVGIVSRIQSSVTRPDNEEELFVRSVCPDSPTVKLLFIISHQSVHLAPRSLLSPPAFIKDTSSLCLVAFVSEG